MGNTQLSDALAGVQVAGLSPQKFSSHSHGSSAHTASTNPHDERPVGGKRQNSYTAYEERAINATGHYDLSAFQGEEFDFDDIEIEDNYSEIEPATMNTEEIDKVKNIYGEILHAATAEFVAKNTLQTEEEMGFLRGKQDIVEKRQRDKEAIRE